MQSIFTREALGILILVILKNPMSTKQRFVEIKKIKTFGYLVIFHKEKNNYKEFIEKNIKG